MDLDKLLDIESSLKVLIYICYINSNYKKENTYIIILSNFK